MHSLAPRFLISLTVAVVLSLSVLLLMQALVSQEHAIASKDYDFDMVDFVRIKRESEIETRERRIPKKPEPQEQLKPKKLAITPKQDITTQDLDFDLPALDLPSNITGGPRLAGLLSHSTGGTDSSIIPLARIQPQYPRRALRRNIEGEVVLAFTITPVGTVENVSVVHAAPPGVFDRAAKQAILKWKFKPKVVDGKALPQKAEQKLVFTLDE